MKNRSSKFAPHRFRGYQPPRTEEKRICTPCKAVCMAVSQAATTPIFGILAGGAL